MFALRVSGSVSMFFFFQAEDGIRDYKVTGVQTCALPIFVTGAAEDAILRRDAVALAQRCLASRAPRRGGRRCGRSGVGHAGPPRSKWVTSTLGPRAAPDQTSWALLRDDEALPLGFTDSRPAACSDPSGNAARRPDQTASSWRASESRSVTGSSHA